jgi:hypothetical protein
VNGHPDREKRLAAVAAAHDDWADAHADDAEFDPERAAQKPGSDYNQHYLDVNPPPGAEEDFHRRVRQAASAQLAGTITAQTLDLAVGPGGRPPGPGDVTERRIERARFMAEHAGILKQALGLATAAVTVAPEAMKPPGLPVPDDPAAISIFTAHRVNSILHQVAHATERMQAAKAASGDLRAYHVTHIAEHLRRALDSGHEMTVNLREHYPAEAAELDAVKESVGLAKSVSPTAKAATTAHLLETTLHELSHASLHAQAMGKDDPGGDEWAFDADHCASHLDGAVEHAGKLWEHLHDNYPRESKWLTGIAAITHPLEAQQHAGDGGTVSAQMANPETITGQLP